MASLPTQHALCALNVPVSSADAVAELALNSYRPITNWCVLADSLSDYLKNPLKSSVQRHGMETYRGRPICRFKGYDCSQVCNVVN